jgi:hypothetical protein
MQNRSLRTGEFLAFLSDNSRGGFTPFFDEEGGKGGISEESRRFLSGWALLAGFD